MENWKDLVKFCVLNIPPCPRKPLTRKTETKTNTARNATEGKLG